MDQKTETAVEVGPGGVPKGTKTSDCYRTDNIPTRFDNPEWFKTPYTKPQHPMYRTTAQVYGSKAPSVHTMPTCFHAKSQQFTQNLGVCGMYRNHSLNTAPDRAGI
ncbi:UPF0691 protein C9orf116 homolog [Gigantopelta aegis]|uniref:UPF0691 protein C9orf116 homolog n=1 Tax=Gigantopelta aegis TaxID=1735272 RepID=UPI001B889AFC|nr:UPF0691 protein C9orf116 homolog [Gigantopelta aegis]